MTNDYGMSEEYCAQILGRILDVNDAGGFNDYENPPRDINYGYLAALLGMRGMFDGIDELYESLYDYAVAVGKYSILKKNRSGEKIRIIFLLYSASQWSVDSLYRLLKKDERFEVKILLAPRILGNWEDTIHTYTQSLKFFVDNGYDVINCFDDNNRVYSWDNIGGVPDILLHLTSWNGCFPEEYQLLNLPFTTLNAYIPYALSTVDNPDNDYVCEAVCNMPFMNFMWQLFMPFEQEKMEYEQYEYLKGKNVSVTGYPKMDDIVFHREYTEEDIRRLWKIPDGKNPDDMKKVIVSPHYTLMYYEGLCLSTFHENAYFLLYLARKYRDKISFIFKPHPNLRMSAVEKGFFSDYEQYDEYIEAWNELPNARSVEESAYIDWFNTSDGCINDSGSFLMEYQFTGKPMLYLRKETQRLRSYYNVLSQCVYETAGNNYIGIEDFLENVIIKENDVMKNDRKIIFSDNFNYNFDISSAEMIFAILCSLFDR